MNRYESKSYELKSNESRKKRTKIPVRYVCMYAVAVVAAAAATVIIVIVLLLGGSSRRLKSVVGSRYCGRQFETGSKILSKS